RRNTGATSGRPCARRVPHVHTSRLAQATSEAEQLYRRAHELEPNNAGSLNKLGTHTRAGAMMPHALRAGACLASQEKVDDAIEVFQSALQVRCVLTLLHAV